LIRSYGSSTFQINIDPLLIYVLECSQLLTRVYESCPGSQPKSKKDGKLLHVPRLFNQFHSSSFLTSCPSPLETGACVCLTDFTSAMDSQINEKEKQNVPPATLSRSLHLSWGLDHYPNYLYRQKVLMIIFPPFFISLL
jgi:hypothetical protein